MNVLQALRRFFQDIQDARTRGKLLLRANLTAVQLRELDALNYFEVTGGASGTRYRIHNSANINVDELDEHRKVVCKLCFGPESSLMRGDILLAQKLALELFECDALAIAKRHPVQQFAPHWSRPAG